MIAVRALCLVIVLWPSLIVAQTSRRTATATSNEPASVAPRNVQSRHFLLHTDLNDSDAKDLLERLETMLELISAYWARPNQKMIECYVVKDLKNWPPGSIDPVGLASIQRKAGVTATTTRSLGAQFDAKSIVYAIADRGTPQHEAVHAYCGQNFGYAGPVWYAEGMAEMGQYWKKGAASVNCSDYVVEFIRSSEPKTLNEIVNSEEQTGDSWQNYAWRWALCHLLANNPNYRQRFRPLGLALLTRQRASFNGTYGNMAEEISFEYLFFLKYFDVGFRADLVYWDWTTKFRAPRGASTLSASINSKGGWQASRCRVRKGQEFEYSAAGKWTIDVNAEQVDANGAEDGSGRLLGVLFDSKTYELGESFELGTYGTWTAPADGDLYLRANDLWQNIDDGNAGKLSFRIKLKGSGNPLPEPKDESKTTRRVSD